MSINIDRVVADNSVLEILKSMSTCKICSNINIEQANKLECDQHKGVYCNQCIANTNCKVCRPKKGGIDPQIMKILAIVKIRCSNFINGCNELLSFECVPQHEVFCPFQRPFGQKKARDSKNLEFHISADPYVPKYKAQFSSDMPPTLDYTYEPSIKSASQLEIAQMNKRLSILESWIFNHDGVHMRSFKETEERFGITQKSVDDSYKAFCESNYLN